MGVATLMPERGLHLGRLRTPPRRSDFRRIIGGAVCSAAQVPLKGISRRRGRCECGSAAHARYSLLQQRHLAL